MTKGNDPDIKAMLIRKERKQGQVDFERMLETAPPPRRIRRSHKKQRKSCSAPTPTHEEER